MSLAFAFLPSAAQAQSSVNINDVTPKSDSAIAGAQLTVYVTGTVKTLNGPYVIFLSGANVAEGNASGYNVSTNFTVAISPGRYNVTLRDVNATIDSVLPNYHVIAEGISAIPIATVLIMLVAIGISLANMTVNRLLITKMIGWNAYRSMQKEMSEYNSQRMSALRSKDAKTLERLKKKESQIQSMQTKMMKPQMLLIPITFVYLLIWPALTGVFPFIVAYVPGLGAQPFFVWYLISSFFFGTIVSRLMGITPIQ
jgi:uncharacterized membrane protein (DUF106 family)